MSSSPSAQPFPDRSAPEEPQQVPEQVASHAVPLAQTEPETHLAHEQKREPSPPWYGGMLIFLIGLMAAILLTYTLLDWGPQQALGWWNYVIAAALIPAATIFMLTWQPDETL